MSDPKVNEAVSAVVNEVVVDQLTGKKFYFSKTFWANVLMAGAVAVQANYGFVISPELQMLAMSFINVALRKISKEPIVW